MNPRTMPRYRIRTFCRLASDHRYNLSNSTHLLEYLIIGFVGFSAHHSSDANIPIDVWVNVLRIWNWNKLSSSCRVGSILRQDGREMSSTIFYCCRCCCIIVFAAIFVLFPVAVVAEGSFSGFGYSIW